MNIKESVGGAWRRARSGVLARRGQGGATVQREMGRKTQALPSILSTYGQRAEAMPKATPVNLRKFSETPVARKAINTIKDRIAGMRWRVQIGRAHV